MILYSTVNKWQVALEDFLMKYSNVLTYSFYIDVKAGDLLSRDSSAVVDI